MCVREREREREKREERREKRERERETHHEKMSSCICVSSRGVMLMVEITSRCQSQTPKPIISPKPLFYFSFVSYAQTKREKKQ